MPDDGDVTRVYRRRLARGEPSGGGKTELSQVEEEAVIMRLVRRNCLTLSLVACLRKYIARENREFERFVKSMDLEIQKSPFKCQMTQNTRRWKTRFPGHQKKV